MLSACLALQALVLFGQSDHTSVADAQIVGEWEQTAEGFNFSEGSATITYSANHTCMHKETGFNGTHVAHGTWKLYGRRLVTRFGKDVVVRSLILRATSNEIITRSPDGTV